MRQFRAIESGPIASEIDGSALPNRSTASPRAVPRRHDGPGGVARRPGCKVEDASEEPPRNPCKHHLRVPGRKIPERLAALPGLCRHVRILSDFLVAMRNSEVWPFRGRAADHQNSEIPLTRLHPRRLRTTGPSKTGAASTATRKPAPLEVLPLPRYWGPWVVLYSAVVLCIGFTATNTPGFSGTEFAVDQELSRHHDGALTVVAMVLNYVFSPVGGLLMIAATCLYLLVARRSAGSALAFGGVAAAGWMSSQLFKVIVDRPRPDPALLLDPLAPETGFNSFPSGHVALAVGLGWAFFFLARTTRWSRLAAWAGILVPVIVAWSRLYIGVHYPTDVTASFLAATAAVFLFAGTWNRHHVRLLEIIAILVPGARSPKLPSPTS